MKNFKEKVLEIVKMIPRGKTMSYKEVAKMVGSPRAYRAVGSIMANNFRKDIPCHRVIKSNGNLGHYNRGGLRKKLPYSKKKELYKIVIFYLKYPKDKG